MLKLLRRWPRIRSLPISSMLSLPERLLFKQIHWLFALGLNTTRSSGRGRPGFVIIVGHHGSKWAQRTPLALVAAAGVLLPSHGRSGLKPRGSGWSGDAAAAFGPSPTCCASNRGL